MPESNPTQFHSELQIPRREGLGRWWKFAGAVAFLGLVTIILGLGAIPSFLAVTHRVPTRYLVVEGWVPEYVLLAAVKEFRTGGYQQVFTTGGPFFRSQELVAHVDYAHRGEAALRRLGLSTNEVTAVPAPPTHRDRTYLSAIALRDYLKVNDFHLESVNVLSLGAHTRRSGLCFGRAFGAKVSIGTIAIENLEYDPNRWWKFSEGVKEIAGESLAFTYAWLNADYGN